MSLWPGLISLVLHLPAHAMGKELVVGIHPDRPIRALIAHHEPLVAHLRQELDRPVRLVSAKDSRAFGQHMLKGEYELALAPAHLARLAQKDRNWHPLARYESEVTVFLLTRKSETEFTPANLKNKVLAISDRTMLMAMAGERWLAQQNLLADSDYTVLVTGSYASAVNAVVTGRADMALGTSDGMEQTRTEDIQLLRVTKGITTIPRMTFIARHDVPAQTRAEYQRALLAYRSPAAEPLVAMGGQDLSAMDVYLPKTRLQLQTSTHPVRPRL